MNNSADNSTAHGTGLASIADDGTVMDVYYPAPGLGSPTSAGPDEQLAALAGTDQARTVRTELVRTELELAADPVDAADIYLRLHLLSHRLVKPHGLNLSNLFNKFQVLTLSTPKNQFRPRNYNIRVK